MADRDGVSFLFVMALAAALPLGLAAPAHSQSDVSEKSAAEIGDLFKAQTRGLVIAPAANSASAEGAPEVNSTAVAPADGYVEIAKDVQVNVSITFDFDSSALRNDQKPKLASLCDAIRSSDIKLFRIVGHTDASGTSEYNDQLSLLRAQEVKRHMVGECGIETDRLEAVGVGERYPYNAANPTGDENRRVEFQALS